MIFLLLAISAIQEEHTVLHDHVDVIEINHIYDKDGHKTLDQVIFWDWCVERHVVVAWMLLKDRGALERSHEGWQFTWMDKGHLRRVTAGSWRETWTQYDPELLDRELLPDHLRRGLRVILRD